jgi:hypothetical protein
MKPPWVAALGVACLTSALLAGCSSTAQPDGAPGAAQTAGTGGASTQASSPSSTNDRAPVSSVTACGLVTEQEVGAVLGSDPGVGTETTSQDGATQCSYGASPSFALVTMLPSQGQAAYDSAHSQVLASDAGPMMSEVTGVGDAALVVDNGIYATIEFYSGPAFVSIVLGSSVGSTVDAATILAKIAAGRL